MTTTKKPRAPEIALASTSNTINKTTDELTLKEARFLLDVRNYTAEKGILLASSAEINALMQASSSISQADLEWKKSPSYPSPYLAELNEITIIPGCRILLTATGEALSDEIDLGFRMLGLQPKLWDMNLTEGPYLHFNPSHIAHSQISAGIHLTGEHEANYFHWIVEILPRLFLSEKLLIDKRIPILVTEGLHDNLYSLLESICAPERPILKLKKDSYYQVTRLIYPSDLTRIFDTYDRAPSKDTTYLPVDLLREMVVKIKQSQSTTNDSHSKQIYIKRVSNYRRLLNEMEIETLLKEKGFDIVDPGNLKIEEQIDLFSQAKCIVGPSGAGMVNMLWCKPGTHITILHSNHPFKKYPYWDALARASGVNIDYLAGPRAHNVTDMFEAHDDFTIIPETLVMALKRNFCVCKFSE